MQDQAQICTTHSAFEVFNCKSTAIERQGDCGAVTAASEHISAAALENTAELVTSKSTSNTAPADDSEEEDLQGHREGSYRFD